MDSESVKDKNECKEEKPKTPDVAISEEQSSKAEVSSENVDNQSLKVISVLEDAVAAKDDETKLDDENSIKKDEEINLHKSIESILSESEGEDTAHQIEDDEEEEEVAEESAYEEELIEDTDPEDQESENAVVLSSDEDDEEDNRLSIRQRDVDEHIGDTSQEDEEYDDDYDDNDLMDSVILSSKKSSEKMKDGDLEKKKRKRSERDSTEEREATDNRLDWRADLKKRLKSGTNAFNESKISDALSASPHSEDEDDYVLDIDVEMGVESTNEDDGYLDESDGHSSDPSSESKTKTRDVAVIELDSSPEKSPRKPLSSVEKSNSQRKNENDIESCDGDIHENSLKKPAKDTIIAEEAEDDTIVPTENIYVPNDDKNIVLEKSFSPADIPKETNKINDITELTSNDLSEKSKVPNEERKDDIDNIKDDAIPTENVESINEEIVQNRSKSDLKESIDKEEHESKTSRINKRRRSSSFSIQDEDIASNSNNTIDPKTHEEGLPAKKLKAELDTIFPKHNQVLTDYINKTSNETVDNIQCHINQLLVDIQTLNDMIKTNENEWNNMIYLKKMKEEICIRLTRKKQTIQLESKKIGDISDLFNDLTSNETLMPKNEEIENQRGPHLSSTPLHHKNCSGSNQNLSEPLLDGFDSNSKSFTQSSVNMIIQNRANMKSSELAKEKLNMQKVHSILVSRNILPKPTTLGSLDAMNLASSLLNGPSSQNQGILNSYLSTSGFQQLGEMLNGHTSGSYQNGNHQPLMIGRQGVFKDVKSIIADYRQQHPESVPRRGRRVKPSSQNANAQYDILRNDTNSRPSSNDSSSHSMSNAQSSQFTDFLVQFNKMAGQTDKHNQGKLSVTSQLGCSSGSNSGTYPEVTLHPVAGTTNDQAGSLLHGILTKNPRSKESTAKISSAFSNNFSPTLAKLLTAPERMGSSGNNSMEYQNISKVVGNNSEITITPVLNSSGAQHSLLQQHLHSHHLKELMSKASNNDRIKTEFLNMDDEADDSVDRLVIDEGADGILQHDEQQSVHSRVTSHAIDENDVPFCQGCKKNEAQFVCAGCGNQWYCSRDCQVTAWDDHSEVCTG